ncbi:hypothetical protein KKE48_05255 [Patescibacteria group bacterium]|nr:hypothetical protein [Patescibacteria group bacterium]MBU1500245.1 hypothetical protein [Patescibacteria group bacterium]
MTTECPDFGGVIRDFKAALPQMETGSEISLPTMGELLAVMHIERGEEIPYKVWAHCHLLMVTEPGEKAVARVCEFSKKTEEWNEVVRGSQGRGYKQAYREQILDLLQTLGRDSIDGRAARRALLKEGAQILMDIRQAEEVS